MKDILTHIITFIVLFLTTWLLFGFISLEFNLLEWEEEARLLLVSVSIFLFGVKKAFIND